MLRGGGCHLYKKYTFWILTVYHRLENHFTPLVFDGEILSKLSPYGYKMGFNKREGRGYCNRVIYYDLATCD